MRRLKLLFLLPFVALLSACFGSGRVKTTPEPIIITREVLVPIVGACVPAAMGGAPTYSDTDEVLKAAAGPDERYQLVIAGRAERTARLGEVEPVIAGCPKAEK